MVDQPKTSRGEHHPFRGLVDVMSEMNRAQEQWFSHVPSSGGARSHAAAYVPPADIFALGDDLYVRCEVAGVKTEDVSLTVADGVLTISGERDSELDSDDVLYYTRERTYGEFRRTMLLPNGVTENDVKATIRNGLVDIRISGGAVAKPHSIDIADENDPG